MKSKNLKFSKLKKKLFSTLNPVILANWLSLVFQGNVTFIYDPKENLFLSFFNVWYKCV